MATWQTNPTFVNDQAVRAGQFRVWENNLEYLRSSKAAESVNNVLGIVDDLSITSATFVLMPANEYSITLQVNGGDLLVHLNIDLAGSTAAIIGYFDIAVDGVRYSSNTDGLAASLPGTGSRAEPIVMLLRNISAGEHTFALMARRSAGTLFISRFPRNTISVWEL